MKKHILRTALTLMLCMLALTVSALAEETETYDIPEPVTLSLAEEFPNTDLFGSYVEELFFGDSQSAAYGVVGGNRLAAAPKAHYEILKDAFEDIAAGDRSSAIITINTSTLSGVTNRFSYSSLGYSAGSSSAPQAAFSKYMQNQVQLTPLYSALLHDCPYSQYWHDKTTGVSVGGRYSSDGTYITITEVSFKFEVCRDFASGYVSGASGVTNTTVNTSKTRAATTALTNAKAIVTKYKDKSDYQKMLGYATEICSLVDYNHSAANNGDYSLNNNPWQLIYAFDGDSSTDIVCEGYSKAFQYLCEQSTFNSSITCYSVSGDMDGGPHMWNIVTYGGKNYMVDLTNSDIASTSSGNVLDTKSGLFFAGASGSPSSGYTFYYKGTYPILFCYEDRMFTLWGYDGILKLSSTDLTVSSSAEITKNPSAVYTTVGKTAKFTVAADGEVASYQWQYRTSSTGTWKNSTAASAKKATLSFTTKAYHDGYQYRCKVTGGDGTTKTSSYATLRVLSIKTQPTDKTVATGEKAIFTVKATGSSLKYQWQYKAPDGSWKNSTATTGKTATLSFTAKDYHDGYEYLCSVTDSKGNKVSSDAVKLTVLPATATITSSPKSDTVAAGATASFTVKATGSSLKYQWQYKAPDGSWKNSTATTGKTATLSFTAKDYHDGYQYRCKVTGSDGITKTSSAATLTIAVPAKITSSPKSATVEPGATASFTVKATGSSLKYQWQYKAPDDSWKNSTASSAKKATLTFTAKDYHDGYQYRCKVTGSDGTTKTSSAATLTIYTEVEITRQPYVIYSGDKVYVRVKATGTGLTYQWQYKDSSGKWVNTTRTGATTASLDVTSCKSTYQFRCVVTDCMGTFIRSNPRTYTPEN